jgi:hypothetical protein
MQTTSPLTVIFFSAPVNVGKEVGQVDDQTAQLRTLKALLGDHIANAVEHTVVAARVR